MPRKRAAENSSDSESNDDSDSDYNPKVKQRKTRVTAGPKRKKTARVPTERATVILLAEPTGSGNANLHIDQRVLARIKKALALGSHDGTGEQEAKQAMRIAYQLMAQHNVSQADVLASEKESDKLKRAGQSCVELRSTKDKTFRRYHWVKSVARAVTTLFDCKSYSTNYKNRLVWTFYRLCELTVAAAYGFEMAFNLIMEWGESKRWKLIYRSGVGEGLYRFARRERKEEAKRVQLKERAMLEKAKAEEEEEDRRRLARLASPVEREKKETNTTPKKSVTVEDVLDEDALDPNPPTTFTVFNYGPVEQDSEEEGDEHEGPYGSEDSDEGPGVDFQIDDEQDEVINVDAIDEMLQDIEVKKGENKEVKREEETVEIPCEVKEKESKGKERQIEEPENEQTPWTSNQQLTLFRTNATKVAEDYLKEKKLKLSASRKSHQPGLKTKEQREIFKQGMEDAKKIDLKRKKIKEFGEG